MADEELSARIKAIRDFFNGREDRKPVYSDLRRALEARTGEGGYSISAPGDILESAFEKVAKLENTEHKRYEGDELMAAIKAAVRKTIEDLPPAIGSRRPGLN